MQSYKRNMTLKWWIYQNSPWDVSNFMRYRGETLMTFYDEMIGDINAINGYEWSKEYLEDAKFELILWRVCFWRRSQGSTKQYLVAHLNKSRSPSATVLVQIVASCLDISIALQKNVYCGENHEYGCMTLLKKLRNKCSDAGKFRSNWACLGLHSISTLSLNRFQLITW